MDYMNGGRNHEEIIDKRSIENTSGLPSISKRYADETFSGLFDTQRIRKEIIVGRRGSNRTGSLTGPGNSSILSSGVRSSLNK